MESEYYLIEANRAAFKALYSKHVQRGGQLVVAELQKICKKTGLLPVTSSQDLISHGTIRSIVSRVLKSTSLARAKLNYEDFEEVIKKLAFTAFSSADSIKERVRLFIGHINRACKAEYGLTLRFQTSKTSSKGSVHSSFSQDSELDVNIKEALETLKSTSSSPRESLTRSSIKVGNSLLQKKEFQKQVLLKEALKGVRMEQKRDKEKEELQEFIEMEKKVESEVVKVTVNLSQNEKPSLEIPEKHIFSTLKLNSESLKEIETEKQESLMNLVSKRTEKKKEGEVKRRVEAKGGLVKARKTPAALLEQHKEFVVNTSERLF